MQDYLNGVSLPELAVVNPDFTVLNPREADQEHGQYCHIFQARWQGVVAHEGLTYMNGSRLTKSKTDPVVFQVQQGVWKPAFAQDD